MLFSSGLTNPQRYYSSSEAGGGALSKFHNPGAVLDIWSKLTPAGIQFDDRTDDQKKGKLNLATQFDDLLSNPGNFFEPALCDSELPKYEEALRAALGELNDSGFVIKHLTPIIQHLTATRTQIQAIMSCRDTATFDSLASRLEVEALHLELLEKKMFVGISMWAGDSGISYENRIKMLEKQLGIAKDEETTINAEVSEEEVEALIAGLRSGGAPVALSPETVNAPSNSYRPARDEVEGEVRRAFVSIFSHRLGNIPAVSGEIHTYLNVGGYSDHQHDAERGQIVNAIDIKINHLKFLHMILHHGTKATFGPIVEWGQHRLPQLP